MKRIINKKILILLSLLLLLSLFSGCFPFLPKNQAPIITSTPITAATVGVAYTYNMEATDPDGDTLTYSLTTKPIGMTINSSTGQINWTPTATGDYDVTVEVSDNGSPVKSIIQSFTIHVEEEPEPTNPPPIITFEQKYGSVEGYVYVPESPTKGRTIIFKDLPQAPAGYKPLVGATVGATGFSVGTTTDDNGYFILMNLPIGMIIITITPPSGSGYQPLTISVQVVGDTTVDIGNDGSVSLPSENADHWDVTINKIDTTNWPEVKVYVQVIDPVNNSPIIGATSNNFKVDISGNKIGSLTVTQTGGTLASPSSSSLVIDRSGSMSSTKLSDAKTAAKTFVDFMTANDRAEVVSFSDNVSVDQEFTNDKSALDNAIDSLSAGGMTSLYDGIWKGLDDTDLETNERKAVIALTDGEENDSSSEHGGGSPPDNSDVIGHANDLNIPIYTIGLGLSKGFTVEEGVRISRNFDPIQDLRQIADETRGEFFNAPTSSDLEHIYVQITQRVQQQYIITFTDNTNTNVSEGTLTVQVDYSGIHGEDSAPYIVNVNRYNLNTNITPSGSGYITLDPPSDGTYLPGISVTLTAHGNDEYKFCYWRYNLDTTTAIIFENPTTITMDEDKTMTAVFIEKENEVTYRLLTVGINDDYKDGREKTIDYIVWAVPSAISINELYSHHKYAFDYNVCLKNNEATRSNIFAAIDNELAAKADANDISYFYFAGHADLSLVTGCLLLCYDVPNYINVDELADHLGKIKGTVIVLLDTCYSGAFIGKENTKKEFTSEEFNENIINAFSGQFTRDNLCHPQFQVLTSCRTDQTSQGSNIPFFQYGFFTGNYRAGCGYDDFCYPCPANTDSDPAVSLHEAYVYVRDNISFILDQDVQIYPYGSDFPVMEY